MRDDDEDPLVVLARIGRSLVRVVEQPEARTTVYKLCAQGKLAHVRVSNAIRIAPEVVAIDPEGGDGAPQ